jgi:hypothetical protein
MRGGDLPLLHHWGKQLTVGMDGKSRAVVGDLRFRNNPYPVLGGSFEY